MKLTKTLSAFFLILFLGATIFQVNAQTPGETADNTKWGKNIVYTPQPPPAVPAEVTNLGQQPADMVRPMTYLDQEIVEGAYYTETSWLMKAYPDIVWVEEHAHDFDEVFGLYGSDPENPNELNGEIELWIDGEKHIITKSCIIFIPKGVKHCPLILRRIDQPVFFFTTGPSDKYRF